MQLKLPSTPRYNPWRRDVSSWVLSSEISDVTDGMRGVMAVGLQKTIKTIWEENFRPK